MGNIEMLNNEILEKLAGLPEDKLHEIIDFVEFLKTRERPKENPILNIAGVLSGEPISPEEVEEILYGKDSEL